LGYTVSVASCRKIYLLPVSEGGINLKTADINDLLKVYGLQGIAQKSAVKPSPTAPVEKQIIRQ
jgi:hypothetical protein